MENLASLQKLNLDMSNLEEEEERVKSLKEKLHKSLQTIDSDLEREKSISLDASLNEKRILEEKNESEYCIDPLVKIFGHFPCFLALPLGLILLIPSLNVRS